MELETDTAATIKMGSKLMKFKTKNFKKMG